MVLLGLSLTKISDSMKARYRFYADGLTVFEVADRHGDGWHPWRVEASYQLDPQAQDQALEVAVKGGYVEDAT